jgi:hypothetical protein
MSLNFLLDFFIYYMPQYSSGNALYHELRRIICFILVDYHKSLFCHLNIFKLIIHAIFLLQCVNKKKNNL